MNYEIAKKLKDAGFPQKPSYITSSFTKEEAIAAAKTIREGGIVVPVSEEYLPTLSELIEAITGHLDLIRVPERNTWLCKGGDKYTAVVGETSEEAVANLWLALHGKD